MELTRSDLSNIGFVSAIGTLKLLPFGKQKVQSVVVGEDSGCITCFNASKGETDTLFKTRSYGSEISAIALGGQTSKQEKIFFSTGHSLHGVNRKGKEFFSFETNLSEKVKNIHVQDNKLWTTGDLAYTLFENGKETESFLFDDRANCLAVYDVANDGKLLPVVGCKDGHVRVVSNGRVEADMALDSPISALHPCGSNTSTTFSSESKQIENIKPSSLFFGTSNGEIGELSSSFDPENGLAFEKQWQHAHASSQAAVNLITSYDLSKDDVPDIIVARDDGQLQVFSKELNATGPKLEFEDTVNESIRGVETGVVNTPGYDEIVLCTYSGNILSFSTESLNQVDQRDQNGRTKLAINREGTVQQLQQELHELQEEVSKSKQKIEPYLPENQDNLILPSSHQFKVNHNLNMRPDEAAYCLTCEIPLPIDVIAIHSSVPLDILNSANDKAITSISTPDENGTQNIVYRFTETSKRAEIKFRTSEGQYGEIKVIIVAKLSPKAASQITIPIKPLSMHHRVTKYSNQNKVVPHSKLSIIGEFSLDRVHEWLRCCVPGVPERPPAATRNKTVMEGKVIEAPATTEELNEPTVNFCFENAFIGSQLSVSYRSGSITFHSDSISTLAILREFFTSEASKRSTHVHIRFDINPETVPYFLSLIDEQLCHQTSLVRKQQILEALKEIEMDESSCEYLSEEYKEILSNASTIKTQLETRPRMLQALCGIVSDLFVDVQKFKGKNVNNPMTHNAINQLLQNYNYNDMLEFFQQS